MKLRSKKGQSTTEWLVATGMIVGIGLLVSFTPALKIATNMIEKSAPKPEYNNIARNAGAVLGPDTNNFLKQFKILQLDPNAKDCTNALESAVNSLGGVKLGSASNADLINVITILGQSGGSGQVSAVAMTGSACSGLTGGSQDAADAINDMLQKDVITLDLNEETCEETCTVTTSSNALLEGSLQTVDETTLKSYMTSVLGYVPSGTPEEIIQRDFYIGTETSNPTENYANGMKLMDKLNNDGLLQGDLTSYYSTLVNDTKRAVNMTIEKTKYTDESIKPANWEFEPVTIAVPTVVASTESATVYTPPASGGESAPAPPKVVFCEDTKSKIQSIIEKIKKK